MRSSACDTHFRHCVRSVLCWLAFPLAPALGSTGSAAVGTALFVGFIATMAESDFSRPCIIGYGSSPSRCGPAAAAERSLSAEQAEDVSGALAFTAGAHSDRRFASVFVTGADGLRLHVRSYGSRVASALPVV